MADRRSLVDIFAISAVFIDEGYGKSQGVSQAVVSVANDLIGGQKSGVIPECPLRIA